MSEKNQESKFEFLISNRFWAGIVLGLVLGSVITLTVGYLPLLLIYLDNLYNPITIDDCTYGLHQGIFGKRCIYHSEMQKNLGCENFYLRDGYWWECI